MWLITIHKNKKLITQEDRQMDNPHFFFFRLLKSINLPFLHPKLSSKTFAQLKSRPKVLEEEELILFLSSIFPRSQ